MFSAQSKREANLEDDVATRHSNTTYVTCLSSCLIDAQPLPAHSPAADDNSLIGCTGHDLTALYSANFTDGNILLT